MHTNGNNCLFCIVTESDNAKSAIMNAAPQYSRETTFRCVAIYIYNIYNCLINCKILRNFRTLPTGAIQFRGHCERMFVPYCKSTRPTRKNFSTNN